MENFNEEEKKSNKSVLKNLSENKSNNSKVKVLKYIVLIAVLGVTIYLMHNLAKAFGKDAGFTVGLVLLNTIFMLILAFDKSEYQLNKATEVVNE